MSLIPYTRDFGPVSALDRLQDVFDRVFESPWGLELSQRRASVPRVEVQSDDHGVTLRLEVPGVAPENLSIETRGRTLTISGKREQEAPVRGAETRPESGGGEFSRSFHVASDLDLEKIEAVHKHGVLTLSIPKVEEARPRQIQVRSG